MRHQAKSPKTAQDSFGQNFARKETSWISNLKDESIVDERNEKEMLKIMKSASLAVPDVYIRKRGPAQP